MFLLPTEKDKINIKKDKSKSFIPPGTRMIGLTKQMLTTRRNI